MDNRIFYNTTKKEEPEISKIETRGSTKPKKKFDFNQKKNNTIKSLNEVEYFLNDFKRFKRYIHLYKFFK